MNGIHGWRTGSSTVEVSSDTAFNTSTSAEVADSASDGRADIALDEMDTVSNDTRGEVLCGIVSGQTTVYSIPDPRVGVDQKIQ